MVKLFKVFFVYKGREMPLVVNGVESWPLEKAVEHAKRCTEITKIQTKLEPCTK
jgi:hypothetical protein